MLDLTPFATRLKLEGVLEYSREFTDEYKHQELLAQRPAAWRKLGAIHPALPARMGQIAILCYLMAMASLVTMTILSRPEAGYPPFIFHWAQIPLTVIACWGFWSSIALTKAHTTGLRLQWRTFTIEDFEKVYGKMPARGHEIVQTIRAITPEEGYFEVEALHDDPILIFKLPKIEFERPGKTFRVLIWRPDGSIVDPH